MQKENHNKTLNSLHHKIQLLEECKNIPNEQLIEHLNVILKQARQGEIVSYAAAFQYSDNKFSTGWSISHNSKPMSLHLLGALTVLQTELSLSISNSD